MNNKNIYYIKWFNDTLTPYVLYTTHNDYLLFVCLDECVFGMPHKIQAKRKDIKKKIILSYIEDENKANVYMKMVNDTL